MTNTPIIDTESKDTLTNPFRFKLTDPDDLLPGGIEIYDDFLDDNIFRRMSDSVFGTTMRPSAINWNYEEYQTVPPEIAEEQMMETDPNTEILCDPLDNHQLNQTIWSPIGGVLEVDKFSLFAPIIFGNMGAVACTKLRINLSLHTDKHIENAYHTDWPVHVKRFQGGKTAILYMNTNNGYTKFKHSGDKIKSIANRLVVFPNDLLHTGATTTDTKNRVVLNINFI